MNLSNLFNHRRNLLNNTAAVSNSMDAGEIKEIIAWELMNKIADAENNKVKEKANSPREYYLTLYSQALKTVSGEDVDDILEEEI
jgi:hypothetical protein